MLFLPGAMLLGLACSHEASSEEPGPALVRTVRAAPATLVEHLILAGRIVPPPDRDATLAPLVSGRLVSLLVRQGQSVRKGQVLARVESASLDSAVASAEAAERRAASEMEFRKRSAARSKDLNEEGVSTLEEAESDAAGAVAAEASHAEALAALGEARRRRGWAELTAPFDGIVLRTIRGAGEMVDGTPATPVLEVAAPEPAEAAADATAGVLGRISPGDTAEVHVSGGPAVPARVARVSRAVDPVTGVGEVRLKLLSVDAAGKATTTHDAHDRAMPGPVLGAAVEVHITAASHRAAAAVPAAALRRAPDGTAEVVLAEQGKAHVRAVTTGIVDGGLVEILSGLAGGEAVIVDDPIGLADGAPVKAGP